ncbi:MAG: tetratricopeptide repeat protein, partial [Saprospiraceae bacterium]
MNFLPANRLRLYRNFKAIEAHDFHGLVRYYERFEDGIRALDFDEWLDCTLAYTDALFETGNHGKHLVMCDHLLETLIMHNIGNWGGEDLFARTLFRKAASLYQLQEYAKAEHVLRELIKIYPDERVAIQFLQRCLLQQRPAWVFRLRAVAIGLVLFTTLFIAVEMFVIRPFFEAQVWWAQGLHNILLATSLLLFAFGESLHTWQS